MDLEKLKNLAGMAAKFAAAGEENKAAGKPQAGSDLPAKAGSLMGVFSKMDTSALMGAYHTLSAEAKEMKLNAETRRQAAAAMGVSITEAENWQTTADIMRFIDLSSLVNEHPEMAKELTCEALTVVSTFFPVVSYANTIVSKVPSEQLSKILGAGLVLTPEHIVHMVADYKNQKRAARIAEYDIEDAIPDGQRGLAIICKDELLQHHLKALVDNPDDTGETVIGTKDGTVCVHAWDADKWIYRVTNEKLSHKCLVVGTVKGAENLAAVMRIRFSDYGITYGWSGMNAFITADPKALSRRGTYEVFLKELREMPVPEEIRKDYKLKLDLKTGLKLALATPLIAKDLYDDKYAVARQQLFYGVVRFYYDHLEEFLSE